MDINRVNYETSFLHYLDRELNPADMLKVERFLTENPDLQKEFELLQQTVFLPEDIVYDQKELLLHKEEKRRMIPLYWIRIAASVIILIIAGWLILGKSINNHKREIAVGSGNSLKIIPVPARQIPVKKDLADNIRTDQSVKKDKKDNEKIDQNEKRGIVKSNETSGQSRVEKLQEKYNSGGLKNQQNSSNQTADANSQSIDANNESYAVIQKSNAAMEIQPDRLQGEADLKQVNVLPGARTSTLVLVAAGSTDQLKNGKGDFKEQNFQTENAISIVALNDQNNAITGFFKKLTKHNPDVVKTNNARKVSVSVFQFSY